MATLTPDRRFFTIAKADGVDGFSTETFFGSFEQFPLQFRSCVSSRHRGYLINTKLSVMRWVFIWLKRDIFSLATKNLMENNYSRSQFIKC